MQFHYSTYRIQLYHPFTISRGSRDHYDIVFVYLTEENVTGVGEAAPSRRYHESFDQIVGILTTTDFGTLPSADSVNEVIDHIQARCEGCKALEAAFDVAAHDLWGKLNQMPLYQCFDADPQATPLTSFTIGIDSLEMVKQKVREARAYPILKVKLGTREDERIIESIRNLTDKPIRVDANEGWDLDTAKRMCDWLSTKDIEFVEQPLPADRLEETAKLKEHSPLKIIADENSLTSQDVPRIKDAFHGINIKLMKSGGLREAKKMIQLARENNLEIMFGCMVESSVAVTAAAHLSPLVDYADLDGNILIRNDPFEGVKVREGKLILPDRPGLGVEVR